MLRPILDLPFSTIALVLQGGGALGAYQAGVYECCLEHCAHMNVCRRWAYEESDLAVLGDAMRERFAAAGSINRVAELLEGAAPRTEEATLAEEVRSIRQEYLRGMAHVVVPGRWPSDRVLRTLDLGSERTRQRLANATPQLVRGTGQTDLRSVLKVMAVKERIAMPIRSRRQYEILPQALVITPVQLSGEDARVVAMIVGTADRPGRLVVCPNPRDPVEQLAMFRKVSEIALPWWDRRVAAKEFPQVWVGSTSAADLLEANIRYMSHHDGRKVPQPARENDAADVDPDEPEAEVTERARCESTGTMGDLFAYLSRRRSHAIQMSFMVATERLTKCFVTGQHDGLNQHLGSLLAWIEPPAGDLFAALRRVEELPYGRNTDPKSDEDLDAILRAYHEATQAGRARDARAAVRVLENHLRPMVERIHATRRAVAILWDVPHGNYAGALAAVERGEFAYFCEHDSGRGYPIFDGPAYAAASLLQQEADADTAVAVCIHDDPLARAQALMRGEVIRGRVTAAYDNGAKRGCEKRITLETPQGNLRARPYDSLHEIGGSGVHLVATAISGNAGGAALVDLDAGAGKTKWVVPEVGDIVECAAKVPDVSRAGSTRATVLARLKGNLPWTHQSPRTRGPAPTAVPLAPRRIDPLAVLRDLR